MEFLSLIKMIIKSNKVDLEQDNCDEKILGAYSKLAETEVEKIQLQEYKNIIAKKKLVYEMYKAYQDCYDYGDTKHFSRMIKGIEEIADALEKSYISCFSYSYFMYAVLMALGEVDDNIRRLQIEEVKWIHPERYDYAYEKTLASVEKTFGFGRYKEDLHDFEFKGSALVRYKGKSGYVIIPNFVKTICEGAFRDNNNLYMVYIPNSVVEMGAHVFDGCENLETVYLSASLTTLPDYAFSHCRLLKRINCEKIEAVGASCFYECVKLKNVKWNALVEVGDSAFGKCSNLTDFSFVNNLRVIGERAFANCQMNGVSLIHCEQLGAGAFADCRTLSMVSIEGELALVGKTPFEGCYAMRLLTLRAPLSIRPHLLFADTIEEFNSEYSQLETINLYTLGDEELKGYENVTSVFVAEGGIVPLSAFEDCTALQEVIFDKEIAHISERAFCNCENLKVLRISYVGESIGPRAFFACGSLTDFAFLDNVKTFEGYCLAKTNLTLFNFNRAYSKIGHFAFANSQFPQKLNLKLLDCIVEAAAFHGLKKVRRFEISSLRNIRPNAKLHMLFEKDEEQFSRSVAIDYIIVGDSAFKESFKGYTNIRYVECDANNGAVPEAVFAGCRNLESVKIRGDVKHIEAEAFGHCEKLSSLDMKYNRLTVGKDAFSYNKHLEKLIDLSRVVAADHYAFMASDLRVANFGQNLQSLGCGVFGDCSYLKEITLPSCDVLNQGENYGGISSLFEICYSDGTVSDGETVALDSWTILSETLPEYAFWGIKGIRKIYLPNIVEIDDLTVTDDMAIECLSLGAGLASFSARSFANLKSGIGIEIDPSCPTFKSVGNSVRSKDGRELFYLGTGDNFGNYADQIKVIHSFAIPKYAKVSTLVVKGDMDVDSSAIQVMSLKRVVLESGAQCAADAFEGVKAIDCLAIDTWDVAARKIFASTQVKELHLTDLGKGLRGGSFEKVVIEAGDLCRYALKGATIGRLEILGVGRIEPYALEGANIDELILHDVKEIYPSAFANSEINNVQIVGNTSYKIKDRCLYNADSLLYCFNKDLREFVGGAWLKNISAGAFERCSDLACFECVNDGLTIDETAFVNCDGLHAIKIGVLKKASLSTVFGTDKLHKVEFHGVKVPRKYFYKQSNLEIVSLVGTKEVGDLAFAECRKLQTVAGLGNIVDFGDLAFYHCSSIQKVTISKNCERLGLECFAECDKLSLVEKPILNFEVENELFYQDIFGDVVQAVVITHGDIPQGYFADCGGLKDIQLPKDCVKIGAEAFKGCVGLAHMEIPSSVQEIGKSALAGCVHLAHLTIPFIGKDKTDTQPLSYVFDDKEELGLKTLSVTKSNKLALNAFSVAAALERIQFQVPPEKIPDACFKGLSVLTLIEGMDAVTEIGAKAFEGCKCLKEFNFSKVKKIGEKALYKCSSLHSLTLAFLGETAGNTKPLHYLLDAGDCAVKSLTVQSGGLVKEAFKGFTSLEEIEVKGKVDSIPQSCFEGLANLTKISLNGVIKTVEDKAFKGCKLVKAFDFANVTHIGTEAFCNTDICEVNLSLKCEGVGEKAFSGCGNISKLSINIPEADYFVKTGVLTKNLKEVELLGGMLYKGIFNGCTNLEKVELHNGCVEIPDKAFTGCTKLKKIDLNKVETIGVEAFKDCTSLSHDSTSVLDFNLKSVSTLGRAAFENTKLYRVLLSDSLTIIPERCFAGCTNLRYINMPNALKEIGGYAFEKTAMKGVKLEMPITVKKLGEYIFKDADAPVVCMKWVSGASHGAFNTDGSPNWDKACKKHGFFRKNTVTVKF